MSPGPPDLLDIPGKRATFTSGSEEEIRLGSRVTFNDQSVNIEGVDFQMNEASNQSATFHDDEHVQKREQWDNKTQFYMGVVSYAVGLGNVWRFPYLCQKNGGGAFLIPYVIMMVLLGLPLFLIELGIGQRLRTGPMGVWNAIHPYLGGLGVSAAVVSYLVALYYNVIITWCLYYLKESFALNLPWGSCPRSDNGTIDKECAMSSSTTMYFWNRQALDTTGSIGDLDSFNQHITISLIVAWFLIYLCVMKGIKSSGKAAEGTGLAFVVFTEAILKFPFPPAWSILFFLMLLSLGLGSMFGTLEGVITSLNDSHLITVTKPVLTAVLCASACLVGLLFSTRAGQYWVALFDSFAGSYALMCVAFFEVIAVVYVYGYRRFSRDIDFMTGSTPGQYWLITWRFVAPIIMAVLFTCSVVQSFSRPTTYYAYDKETTKLKETEYPIWAMFIALGMVLLAILPTFSVWFLRYFKIWKLEADIPAASKCLGTTQSTTYMLKSEQSFNRMTESNVSVAEMEPITTTR
ncbi:sodium-dependent neutral amino acid transporter B(0) domain protein [Ostertagia ostertagi]